MSAKHVGLGRGLNALIKDGAATTPVTPRPTAAPETLKSADEKPRQIPIENVRRSPWQPRHNFDREPLEELVASVREHGVLQPLLVRSRDDHFELIAGERRLRAAGEAGLKTVPVILLDVSDQKACELALIENLQRQDLNVIEEAEGYRTLAERFSLTQEDVATRVNKPRATIANSLRLLDLPDPVRRLLAEKQITTGHAKVLLGLDLHSEQELLARRTAKENLSVRVLERIVNKLKRKPRKPRNVLADIPADHTRYLTEKLEQLLSTSVVLTPSKTLPNGKKVKGSIDISFFSNEELDRLLSLLGVSETL